MLEGLRGEDSIAELCRKEGINQNLYYRWSKEFLEAGKKRLAGDTAREATSDEVKELKAEARQLKETLAEVLIENRLLKKAFWRSGRWCHCTSTMAVSCFQLSKSDSSLRQKVVSWDCTCFPVVQRRRSQCDLLQRKPLLSCVEQRRLFSRRRQHSRRSRSGSHRCF